MKVGDKVKIIIPDKCRRIWDNGVMDSFNDKNCCDEFVKEGGVIESFSSADIDRYADKDGKEYKSENLRNICVRHNSGRFCWFRKEQLEVV